MYSRYDTIRSKSMQGHDRETDRNAHTTMMTPYRHCPYPDLT